MKMSRENSSPTDKVCATDPKLNSSGVLRDPVFTTYKFMLMLFFESNISRAEEIGNCLNIFGIRHR